MAATEPCSTILVYDIGTRLNIAPSHGAGPVITATVVGIAIYAGPRVTYEIAWFDGSSRKKDWVDECEVEPGDQRVKVRRIGFREA
jgi:hypothetical protein